MQKKIRIKDIAKMAGVSPGTVDRVLHNRGNVSDTAREAIENVLRQVEYRPNIHVSAISLKREYTIVVTTPQFSEGAYWESIHNGIQHALKEYENIKVNYHIFTYNQYDIYSCKEVFKELENFEMDALIIGPTFKEETIELCKAMDKKGTPYIFVDSAMEGTDPLAFFSADHYTVGRLFAKLITSITPIGSDIGLLQAVRTGDSSANTTIIRKKGFKDYLTNQGYSNKIIQIPFSVSNQDNNEKQLSGFFNKHNNITGLVVMNSRGNFIANYLSSNRINNIRLICMDITTPNIEAMKNGQIDFLISQEPEYQGFFSMKTLLEFLIIKRPVNKENYVQLDILTSETIDYYKRFNNIVYNSI